MRRSIKILVVAVPLFALLLAGCGRGGDSESSSTSITIGWTPPDITGVFKTATKYFEESAKQANQHGLNVKVVTRAPAQHTAFADQVSIVEDYISQGVDVIAISPADPRALKPALRQANDAGIPVVMVNLLRKQEGVDIASYIGFDNEEAAEVTAYSVLDYFGGPGVLGSGKEIDVKKGTDLDLSWWKKVYSGQPQPEVDDTKGVFIEGIAGTFFTRARTKGFTGVLEALPGVQESVVVRQ